MKTLFAAQARARQGHWWRMPLFAAFLLAANAGIVLGQTTLITVLANTNVGGTTEPSGPADYLIGTQIQISARANSGWVFTGWSDGDPNDERTITVTETPITYTANFVQLRYGLSPLALRSGRQAIGPSTKHGGLYAAAACPTVSGTAVAIRAKGTVEMVLEPRAKGGDG